MNVQEKIHELFLEREWKSLAPTWSQFIAILDGLSTAEKTRVLAAIPTRDWEAFRNILRGAIVARVAGVAAQKADAFIAKETYDRNEVNELLEGLL